MSVLHILPDPDNPEHPRNRIKAVLIDKTDMIWIVSELGLGRLLRNAFKQPFSDMESPSFRFDSLMLDVGNAQALVSKKVNSIVESANSQVWMLADSLYKIEGSHDAVKITAYDIYAPSDPYAHHWQVILGMPASDNSLLWIGGIRCIVIFDIAQETFSEIAFDRNDLNSPIHFSITALFKDQSSIVWVGTDWGGLYKYDPFTAFSQYHPTLEQIRQKTSRNLRTVVEDSRGNLWLTADKVYRSDRQTGKTNLTLGRNDFTIPATHFNSTFNAILEDHDNNIWLASEANGFFRFDPGSQKIVQRYPGKNFYWFGKTGVVSTVNVAKLPRMKKEIYGQQRM